jgi:hypothetical protein
LATKTRRKGVEHKDKRKPKATSKKGKEKKPLRIKQMIHLSKTTTH